jgi:hypothetical protein
MAEQVPSVGRIVHFVYGDRHVPAIVIDPEQNDGEHKTQALQVFTVDAGSFMTFADYDGDWLAPGTWHWPEYVAPKSIPAITYHSGSA